MAKEWFILHTQSGQEERVKRAILREAEVSGLMDHIGSIIIPEQEVEEERGGKKHRFKRRVYPRYIFIEMEYTQEAKKGLSRVLRGIPGVLGLIGGWEEPHPLSDEEASEVQQIAGIPIPHTDLLLQKGDTVRILSGPFMDFSGTLQEVDPSRGKVRILISLFGRDTPVELEIDQVRKV